MLHEACFMQILANVPVINRRSLGFQTIVFTSLKFLFWKVFIVNRFVVLEYGKPS